MEVGQNESSEGNNSFLVNFLVDNSFVDTLARSAPYHQSVDHPSAALCPTPSRSGKVAHAGKFG